MESDKQEKDENGAGFLKEIMAISGHPGLYKFISQARNGIIVEHMDTGKRMQAFSSMKISALEEIAIFTEEEEVSLAEVLKLISDKENGGVSIDFKSDSEKLKSYFETILPEYDKNRVYVSDIKKVLNWYNILHKHDLLKFDEEDTGSADEDDTGASGDVTESADKEAETSSGKDSEKKSGKETSTNETGDK